MKILFSEGSSLTAREFLSVLGPHGHWIEVVDANPTCICRFSRWTKRVHHCPPPGADPLGYLKIVNGLLADGKFDVLLPTHEQAWLFAVAAQFLDSQAQIAVASVDAYSRVQSKIEFARLLDEMNLPQPKWGIVGSPNELANWQPPYYLKAPFSTAGVGVYKVNKANDAKRAFESLKSYFDREPIMVQAAANGNYAQVQALFDHGRLVAAHTSMQTAIGVGPSAAGRISVDHPFARSDIAMLGKYLNWHGGLTLDYIFREGERSYIECNPRTVEPANAVASGVDLPELQLALSVGEHPNEAPVGHSGVQTHGSLAILLGTAVYTESRKALLSEAIRLALHQAPSKQSRECLTPFFEDLPSIVPLMAVIGCGLLSPARAERLGRSTIRSYSITPDAIKRIQANLGGSTRHAVAQSY